MKIFYIILILALNLVIAHVEFDHKIHQFQEGGVVKQLCTKDFEDIMLNQKIKNKPWFIMFYAHWCEQCFKLIPFWYQTANKYKDQFNFGAVECHENEDIWDRFDIINWPSFILINEDQKKYYFIGKRDIQTISEWIEKKQWIQNKGNSEIIPDSIQPMNYLKRFLRRLFHPIALGSFLITTIVLIALFMIFDNIRENRRIQEARKIKQELIAQQKLNEKDKLL